MDRHLHLEERTHWHSAFQSPFLVDFIGGVVSFLLYAMVIGLMVFASLE